MPSPLQRRHGRIHPLLARWLDEYEEATPGTEAFDSASTLLGQDSEPQPDLCLLIDSSKGGQTRDQDDYIVGAPELIIEIASSTESFDLFKKKADYERHGALEYLVPALRQKQVFWFICRSGKFEPLSTGSDGIYRSETFPGLWLDPAALLARDRTRLLAVLRQGLASPEHSAFVARLNG